MRFRVNGTDSLPGRRLLPDDGLLMHEPAKEQ